MKRSAQPGGPDVYVVLMFILIRIICFGFRCYTCFSRFFFGSVIDDENKPNTVNDIGETIGFSLFLRGNFGALLGVLGTLWGSWGDLGGPWGISWGLWPPLWGRGVPKET